MEAEANRTVREIEVELKQKELEATVIKPAEAENQATIMRAEAAKQRKILEAEAEAATMTKRGLATAEAELAKGKPTQKLFNWPERRKRGHWRRKLKRTNSSRKPHL